MNDKETSEQLLFEKNCQLLGNEIAGAGAKFFQGAGRDLSNEDCYYISILVLLQGAAKFISHSIDPSGYDELVNLFKEAIVNEHIKQMKNMEEDNETK